MNGDPEWSVRVERIVCNVDRKEPDGECIYWMNTSYCESRRCLRRRQSGH